MFGWVKHTRRRPFLPLVALLCTIVVADTALAITDHGAEAIGLLAFVAPLVLIVAQGSETHATTLDTNRKVDDMMNGVLERKIRRAMGIEIATWAAMQEKQAQRTIEQLRNGEPVATPIYAVPLAPQEHAPEP